MGHKSMSECLDEPPVVQIIDPPDGATVTAPTDIIGTLQHANLAYWKLSFRPAGSDDDAWVEIGRSEFEVPDPAPLKRRRGTGRRRSR